jgi:hypothetical protein
MVRLGALGAARRVRCHRSRSGFAACALRALWTFIKPTKVFKNLIGLSSFFLSAVLPPRGAPMVRSESDRSGRAAKIPEGYEGGAGADSATAQKNTAKQCFFCGGSPKYGS